MQFFAAKLRDIYLGVEDTFLGYCIVTDGRKLVVGEIRFRDGVLGDCEQTGIAAVGGEEGSTISNIIQYNNDTSDAFF